MDALTHPERRARRAEAAAAVAEGMPPAEAALKYEIGINWVRQACAEHGVTLPVYHKAGVVEVVAALMQAEPGETISGVGKACCVSRQRVHQILTQCQRYGIIGKEWPPNEHPARDKEVGASGR